MNKKAEYGGLVLFLLIVIFLMAIGWAITGYSTKEPDSDEDGLSDVEELRIGTNLSNPNTDGDRYSDGEEIKLGKNPLKPNSANITVYLVDKSWDWSASITNVISLALKLATLNSETVLADANARLLIKNSGDDYSEYVNYNVIFEVSGQQVRSIPTSLGRLNEGEEKTIDYHEEILLKDIPNLLLNSIVGGNTNWEIKVNNLNYKKFIERRQ
jgi:hypothetical protein